MRRSIPFLLSISVLGLAAQQPWRPVFQAEANLVVVRAQVFDGETRQPIVGLTRSDFQVFDESSPAELTVFDNSPAPLTMLLLIDVSGGFTNQHIATCSRALYSSLTAQDQVALMSFSDGPPNKRTDFTSDEEAVTKGWRVIFDKDRNNRMRSVKTSRMFDAIRAGAQYFLETPEVRRPAIAVVTHNREARSRTTAAVAMETLLESYATLEAVVLPRVPPPAGYFFGWGIRGRSKTSSPTAASAEFLPDLGSVDPFAKATGGQTLRLDLGEVRRTASSSGARARADWAASEIAPLVEDLMSRLRSQYTLGIRGASTGERRFRRLSVRLTEEAQERHPNAVVRTRSGYWTAAKGTDAKK